MGEGVSDNRCKDYPISSHCQAFGTSSNGAASVAIVSLTLPIATITPPIARSRPARETLPRPNPISLRAELRTSEPGRLMSLPVSEPICAKRICAPRTGIAFCPSGSQFIGALQRQPASKRGTGTVHWPAEGSAA